MAYKNQNYMTNKKIKQEVDKNQKGYVAPEEDLNTEQLQDNNPAQLNEDNNIEQDTEDSPDILQNNTEPNLEDEEDNK